MSIVYIEEKRRITVGAFITGHGSQKVEVRLYPVTPDDYAFMVCVNGRDNDVAYIKLSDLAEVISALQVK